MPANLYTPSINAGELRHQVEIQSQSTTQDSFGSQVATWNTIRQPNASITVVAAPQPKESFQAGQFSAQVSHVISIRYTANPAILGGMRVVFGSHTYLIQTVDNVDQRNIRVNLMCLEIDGSQ